MASEHATWNERLPRTSYEQKVTMFPGGYMHYHVLSTSSRAITSKSSRRNLLYEHNWRRSGWLYTQAANQGGRHSKGHSGTITVDSERLHISLSSLPMRIRAMRRDPSTARVSRGVLGTYIYLGAWHPPLLVLRDRLCCCGALSET